MANDKQPADAAKSGSAANDEIQFFDTTVTKLVQKQDGNGNTEWVEVMSDNLYPGEKLKRVDDEEKAEKKATAKKK
jgi:hypothetical protein